MFAEHISAAILALACADRGVTPGELNRLTEVLSGNPRASAVSAGTRLFVTYREAATMLDVSLPTIKRLVKRGRLKPVIGTGSKAIGIYRQSINEMVGLK